MAGTKGEIEYAIRRALNKFDEWNDVAGVVPKFHGYYHEMQSVLIDAVHCGFQRALGEEKILPSEEVEEVSDKYISDKQHRDFCNIHPHPNLLNCKCIDSRTIMPNVKMKFWIVMQWKGNKRKSELSGVFDSKELADQSCRDYTYFIWPDIELNEQLPDESVEANAYYPISMTWDDWNKLHPVRAFIKNIFHTGDGV